MRRASASRTLTRTIMTASIPPGIVCENGCVERHSGGTADEWMGFEKVKLYTNAFILEEGRVTYWIICCKNIGG